MIGHGIELDCLNEPRNKFYFDVTPEIDVGATMAFAVFNSTSKMCLTREKPEGKCDQEVKLYHNQERLKFEENIPILFSDEI